MKPLNQKRAKEIIDQFSGKKILVVGDIMLDRYVFGNVERLNPEAPVPVLHAQTEKLATGAAGNVAKNAAALGVKARLVGVVGDDEVAVKIIEESGKEGYEAQLIVDDTRPTIEKIRYLVGGQQMLRVDYEETRDIGGEVEKDIINVIRGVAEDAEAIIISDYAKGVVTELIARAIMDTHLPVMADVKPSRAEFFVGAMMISPNIKEGHEFLGLNHLERGGKDVAELAALLQKKFQSEVYLTLGAGGMYVLSNGAGEHVPQEHVAEVFDVSGAGDTAAVVLTLARICGASSVEAAQLANAAAAVAVSKIGAVAVTPDKILNMITHKHA